MRLHAQTTLRATIILSFLAWTSLFSILLLIEYPGQDERFEQMINLRMEMLYQRVQAVRSWIGTHGGVYAAVDEVVKPSERLNGHPERDIVTPSGRHLTLLNSPAFLRQISDEFEAEDGTSIRFVSDLPLYPANMVDDWERAGLEELRAGNKEIAALIKEDGQIRYRLLRPMVLREQCLSCHQGGSWKAGDIAGAISINLDAATEYHNNQSIKHVMLANHLIMWLVGVVGIVFAWRLWRRLLKSLERSALLDPLTGIYNRREMLNRLEAALSACKRYQYRLSVVMFDIDHFKQINDRYGHQAGDEVLKAVAQAMQQELRASDVLARYGGEEFLVVCTHTDSEAAAIIAERIRTRIAALEVATQRGAISLTLSAGVAGYPHCQTAAGLIEAADAAMYTAKGAGRNRVVCPVPA